MATATTAQYWTTVRREPKIISYWRGNDAAGSVYAVDYGARYDLPGVYKVSAVGQSPIFPLIKGDPSAASMTPAAGGSFQVSDVAVLRLTGDLSLETWIAPSTAAAQSVPIMGKLDSTGTFANPYALRLVAGAIQFAVGNGASEVKITGPVLQVQVPSLVQATSFRGVLALYLNGTVVATGSVGSQTVSDGGQPLWVGNNSANNPFAGSQAESAIYSGALSSRRAAYHFNLGRQVYPDAAHYFGVAPPVLIS
jgi:hypothetical protein